MRCKPLVLIQNPTNNNQRRVEGFLRSAKMIENCEPLAHFERVKKITLVKSKIDNFWLIITEFCWAINEKGGHSIWRRKDSGLKSWILPHSSFKIDSTKVTMFRASPVPTGPLSGCLTAPGRVCLVAWRTQRPLCIPGMMFSLSLWCHCGAAEGLATLPKSSYRKSTKILVLLWPSRLYCCHLLLPWWHWVLVAWGK